jgi:hypothetical protein
MEMLIFSSFKAGQLTVAKISDAMLLMVLVLVPVMLEVKIASFLHKASSAASYDLCAKKATYEVGTSAAVVPLHTDRSQKYIATRVMHHT